MQSNINLEDPALSENHALNCYTHMENSLIVIYTSALER